MMDLFSRFIPLLLSYTTLLTVLQRVKTVSEVIGYQNDDVTLPCHFVHERTEEKLIQVEWNWRNLSKSRSFKIILFNSEHGIYLHNTFLKDRVNFSTNPNLTFEASIIIKHVKLTDQGVYSCDYTTHPSGSQTGKTTLKVKEGKPAVLSTAATAGILTAVLITVILASVGYLFLNKRRRAASTSVNYITQSPGDLQQGEITYADVTVKPGKINRNTSQTGDIEYAAVSFSGHSGMTSQQASANQFAFGGHTAKDASVYTQR